MIIILATLVGYALAQCEDTAPGMDVITDSHLDTCAKLIDWFYGMCSCDISNGCVDKDTGTVPHGDRPSPFCPSQANGGLESCSGDSQLISAGTTVADLCQSTCGLCPVPTLAPTLDEETIQITQLNDEGKHVRIIPCPLSRVDQAIDDESNPVVCSFNRDGNGVASASGPDFFAEGTICYYDGQPHESYCTYRMSDDDLDSDGNCVRCKPPAAQECQCTGDNSAIPDDSPFKGSGYGQSCFAWDSQWDYCDADLLAAKDEEVPSYCPESWCYVQEGCVLTENPPGVTLPDDHDPNEIQAKASTAFPGSGLFYSYTICGQFDDSVVDWSNVKFEPCEPREIALDVYFVVDGSSSINNENWGNQVTFLSLLIREALNVTLGDRAGMIQFSGKPPQKEYGFADSLEHIVDDVVNMVQMKGGTQTDLAIEKALSELSNEDSIDDGRKSVMVLLTDGVPNPSDHNPCSKDNTLGVLNNIRDQQIYFSILAVDMEPEDVGLLSCLVESSRNNIVQMSDFTSFFEYRDPTGPDNNFLCVDPEKFRDLPTNAPTTTPEPTPSPTTETPEPTTPAPTECVKRALDIVFLLDSSGSLFQEGFDLEKTIAELLIRNGLVVDGGPTPRVAVVRFAGGSNGGGIHTDVNFDSGMDKDEVADYVRDNVEWLGGDGYTNTYGAMLEAVTILNKYKTDSTGLSGEEAKDYALAQRQQMILLITDGNPEPDTQNPCNDDIKDDIVPHLLSGGGDIEVIILSVGFATGLTVDTECLVADVSNDIVAIDSFSLVSDEFEDDLQRLAFRDRWLENQECESDKVTGTPTAAPTCEPGTDDPVDVIFLLDGGASVACHQFPKLTNMVTDIARVANADSRISVVTFGQDVRKMEDKIKRMDVTKPNVMAKLGALSCHGDSADAPCIDENEAQLTTRGFSCAFVKENFGCEYDLHNVNPLAPVGSTVKSWCQKTCENCPADIACPYYVVSSPRGTDYEGELFTEDGGVTWTNSAKGMRLSYDGEKWIFVSTVGQYRVVSPAHEAESVRSGQWYLVGDTPEAITLNFECQAYKRHIKGALEAGIEVMEAGVSKARYDSNKKMIVLVTTGKSEGDDACEMVSTLNDKGIDVQVMTFGDESYDGTDLTCLQDQDKMSITSGYDQLNAFKHHQDWICTDEWTTVTPTIMPTPEPISAPTRCAPCQQCMPCDNPFMACVDLRNADFQAIGGCVGAKNTFGCDKDMSEVVPSLPVGTYLYFGCAATCDRCSVTRQPTTANNKVESGCGAIEDTKQCRDSECCRFDVRNDRCINDKKEKDNPNCAADTSVEDADGACKVEEAGDVICRDTAEFCDTFGNNDLTGYHHCDHSVDYLKADFLKMCAYTCGECTPKETCNDTKDGKPMATQINSHVKDTKCDCEKACRESGAELWSWKPKSTGGRAKPNCECLEKPFMRNNEVKVTNVEDVVYAVFDDRP